MALEKRESNLYYYRYVRDGDRVRKIYVGSGELARIAYEQDLIKRTIRKHRRKEEQEELEGLASSVEELCDVTEILTCAYLVASGYRRYQGHWRKRREST